MRTVTAIAVGVTLAFLLGMTGLPGHLVSRTAGWLAESGTVDLEGPVGDAVRVAFPEVDTGDPDED